ncbi:MAG: D-glycerate dehydrogenase, partial [Vicinamibacteria bacterium]|nr:D-glycerate dehydrogenase [Vicinamibacteria bacterium]
MNPLRVFVTADIGAPAIGRLVDSGFEVDVHPAIEAPTYDALTARVATGIDALITTIRDRIDEP